MNKLIIIVALLFSIVAFAQEKPCFKSEKVARNTIIGYWKEKNVETNTFFKFVLKGKKVEIEMLEDLDEAKGNTGKPIFATNETIEIKKRDNCQIAVISSEANKGSVDSALSFISKNEFVYKGKYFERKSF